MDEPTQAAIVGPLQLAIHVVRNRRAGEQESHWDKTNKENYHLKLCMSFLCLVPVRLFLSSVAILYHVNKDLAGSSPRILANEGSGHGPRPDVERRSRYVKLPW